MAEDQKKPDYTDSDWSELIRDREKKWLIMYDYLHEHGIEKTYLWDSTEKIPFYDKDKNTSSAGNAIQDAPSLAILPIIPGKGIVIICAGGGFRFKSANEAIDIAEAFHDAGINAAILDYRHYPYGQEASSADGLRAIRWIRFHAEELGIDSKHIGFGGFSAGGILTSLVNTSFDNGNPEAEDVVERESSRPDACFQMYGSFSNFPDESGVNARLGFSFEQQAVYAHNDILLNLPLDLPPMFIAETDADNPDSPLSMAKAYKDRGIPFEIHIFHGGPHGGGLFNGKNEDSPLFPHTAHWMGLCCEWFKMYGF